MRDEITAGFTMPAEYEKHAATIMVFPERPGSWRNGAGPAQEVFARIIRELAKVEKVYVAVSERTRETAERMLEVSTAGAVNEAGGAGLADGSGDCGNIVLLDIPTDDAWARDIAPTFVKNRKTGEIAGINWRFNAWGGDFNGLYAHWERDDAFAKEFLSRTGYPCLDADPFVLEGGSIHSNGKGTVITTESCLLSKGRNPGLTKNEIENRLKAYLGAERVIWLPRGIYNDETDEHVDNVCAFTAENEVVLAWTDNTRDPQYEMSKACLETLEKEGITVHKLPIPDVPVTVRQEELEGFVFEDGEDTREAGERLAASYVNFYFANGIILLPQFGGENAESDKRAVKILSEICPDRKIIPIPAREIILGGGNIHCITQQIPM